MATAAPSTAGRRVVVTGATGGIGFEAAGLLLEQGWDVVVTGRTIARADDAAGRLAERVGRTPEPIALDLDDTASVAGAVERLADRPIHALILNAGMVTGAEREHTAAGVERIFSASLVGHHVLVGGLVAAGSLAADVRIVISGSEAARGDLPGMGLPDLRAEADPLGGDLVAAARAHLEGTTDRFKPMQAYAAAKLFVAWWARALAPRLGETQGVWAVSPGAVPSTAVSRHQPFLLRRVAMPLMGLLPSRLGFGASPRAGAERYLDGLTLDLATSGSFWATRPPRMSGSIVEQDADHLADPELVDAVWQALVAVTGVDVTGVGATPPEPAGR